uniref:hypothetical protein n=1 Tax=Sphingobium sp. TaxID=1912891 RepID=UPI003B3B95B0
QCLVDAYGRRNGELAIAVLMEAPDQALPILQRLDRNFAPILEAVQLWAAQPVGVRWHRTDRAATRTQIAHLLTPYLTRLQTDEGQSFGWSLLSAPGGDRPAVRRIDDIFLSDRHFAAFLNVLGPYLHDDDGKVDGEVPRTLPCAAIVRHPVLLQATGALFGSTMDNFILGNDCEQTLPALPALTRLDADILHGWPECDGTIRFSAYRSYAYALDLARLGIRPDPSNIGVTSVDGVSAATIAAARTELAQFYAAHLGKASAQAGAMAAEAVGAVLSVAHGCGT